MEAWTPASVLMAEPSARVRRSGSRGSSDSLGDSSGNAPLRNKANAWLEGAGRVMRPDPERLRWVKDVGLGVSDGVHRVGDHFDQAIDTIDERLRDVIKTIPLTVEKAKARLLDMSAPLRKDVLDSLGQVMKNSFLADPDMWQRVEFFFSNILQHLWEDIEHEIEQNIEWTLLKQQEDEDLPGPTGSLGSWVRKFRAFVLHHYLPFNRSFFGKLKDPWYVFFYILLLLPLHGLRVALFSMLLFFLVYPGCPDEYQLLSFILVFKGNQFISQGILMTLFGAMQYHYCYSWDKNDFLECVEKNGPSAGSLVGPLVDYLGSILLVWIAFFALDWSRPYTKGTFVGRVAAESTQLQGKSSSLESVNSKRKGGRMVGLLWWDIKCFVCSMAIMVLLTLNTSGDWHTAQFRANLYWCRVFYSLLALPFFFFQIPFFLKVLTHSTATGFNEQGACVEFELPPVNSSREQARAAKLKRAQTKMDMLRDDEMVPHHSLPHRRHKSHSSKDSNESRPTVVGIPEEVLTAPSVESGEEAAMFEVLEDTDVFPGDNAQGSGRTVLTSKDLVACMRICRVQGFGAFVVWNRKAYFRSESVLACRSRPNERLGATTYLNWNPTAASFEEVCGQDVLPSGYAERRNTADFAACLRHCRLHGYGAMVRRKNMVYFKKESAQSCQEGLFDAAGCTTYINWAPNNLASSADPMVVTSPSLAFPTSMAFMMAHPLSPSGTAPPRQKRTEKILADVQQRH